jgi:hypothetical protein
VGLPVDVAASRWGLPALAIVGLDVIVELDVGVEVG